MYKQVRKFDQSKAGKVPSDCLRNTRLGYSISKKYPDALTAWKHTQQHKDKNIPEGLDIPVFFDWYGTVDGVYKNWGHIGVRLADGRLWTDGRIYPSIDALVSQYLSRGRGKYLGWGESINDTKVVEGGIIDDMTREQAHHLGTAAYRTIYGREPESDNVAKALGFAFEDSNKNLTPESVKAVLDKSRANAEWKKRDSAAKSSQFEPVTEQLFKKKG